MQVPEVLEVPEVEVPQEVLSPGCPLTDVIQSFVQSREAHSLDLRAGIRLLGLISMSMNKPRISDHMFKFGKQYDVVRTIRKI